MKINDKLKKLITIEKETFLNYNNRSFDKDYYILVKEKDMFFASLIETNFKNNNMELENYNLIKSFITNMFFRVKLNNNCIIKLNNELKIILNKIFTNNLENNILDENISIFNIIFDETFKEKKLDMTFWKKIMKVLDISEKEFSDYIFNYFIKEIYNKQSRKIISYIEDNEVVFNLNKNNEIQVLKTSNYLEII